MAILLLCRGDEQSKAILRQAIEAHYGKSPIAFESVRLMLKGRSKQTVGKFNIWLPLELETTFTFPIQFRQDYSIKFWQIPILNESESFDGTTYFYKKHKSRAVIIQSLPDPYIHIVRQRVSTFAAILLLPLSEPDIELTFNHDHSITAHSPNTATATTLTFYENYQLKQAITTSTYHSALFRLDLSKETEVISNIKTFKRIDLWWDNELKYELFATYIEFIDRLEEGIFQLT